MWMNDVQKNERCVCTHTYLYTHISTYVAKRHTQRQWEKSTYSYTCVNTYIRISTYVDKRHSQRWTEWRVCHVYTQIHMHTYIRLQNHMYLRSKRQRETCIYTYICACIHIYIYLHTFVPSTSPSTRPPGYMPYWIYKQVHLHVDIYIYLHTYIYPHFGPERRWPFLGQAHPLNDLHHLYTKSYTSTFTYKYAHICTYVFALNARDLLLDTPIRENDILNLLHAPHPVNFAFM